MDAKKTTVTFGSEIGSLIGPIGLPPKSFEVSKHWANDDTEPTLTIGDPEMGDIELTVSYDDHATWSAMDALAGTEDDLEFTLPNGDSYTYTAVLAQCSPITGEDNGHPVGTLAFVVGALTDSSAGEA